MSLIYISVQDKDALRDHVGPAIGVRGNIEPWTR